jgi:hypothetical protein
MPNQFVIEILNAPDNGVAFRPDLPGAQAGDPLHARPNDLVLWSNRTDRDLTLESIEPPAPGLDQELKAGQTSDLFITPSDGTQSITYRCTRPVQQHVIEIQSNT